MPSDSETRELQKILFSDREHTRTARTVHEAWPEIEARVYKQFMDQVRASVEKHVRLDFGEFASDMNFGSSAPRGEGRSGIVVVSFVLAHVRQWRYAQLQGAPP